LQIISLVTGAMLENAYLVFDEASKQAAVIDPGDDAGKIEEQVDRLGLRLEYILLTHGHADHIGAVDELREKYNAKVAVHALDAEMLLSGEKNLSSFIGTPFAVKAADRLLQDGDVVDVGTIRFHVMHTPGHSKGSVCYLADHVMFSGDTLFEGSIGRTDFPGGSMSEMRASLARLKALEEDYEVYPGHGGATTLEQEKAMNPYLGW